MLKDITLGQFFPGNSVIHKLDPRIKIIACISYIIGIFLCKSAVSYALMLVSALLLVLISRLPVKTVLKSIKPILLVLLFTAVLNIFWHSGETVLFSFWRITVYMEGVISAIYMVLRIVSLVIGTSVILTYTTSPIALTDAIERLLSPLRFIKVPVHEFAMMMTIALRFIPTLIEETDKIMNAQKARGSDFSSGSIVARAKALVPVLVPLFISSFRRADELAVAMECRCYRGGEGRTRMTRLHLAARDFVFMLFIAVFIAAVVLINIYMPFFVV